MTGRVLPLMSLVIVTNIVMLASVRVNRTGAPDATMTLTERELQIERTSDRDSAQKLQLEWWPRFWSEPDETSWLTPDKLATLGITCRQRITHPTVTTESCGLGRRAFVAYEYDGPAWQKVAVALQSRRDAAPQKAPGDYLDKWIKFGSRLVPVDASTDSTELRRAHPDRQRYFIVLAMVQAQRTVDRRTNASPVPVVTGTIEPLTTTLIAPARFRDLLLKLGPSDFVEPRYTVKVAFGRRHEPWILAIDPIGAAATSH
jgi:Domain of unknown function (DUF4824)